MAPAAAVESSGDFMVILVHAPHLNYSSVRKLSQSLRVRERVTGEEEVGHAWVYLQGTLDGERVEWEGGHAGAFGELQPNPGEGVLNLVRYGYVDPSEEEKLHPRKEANPIKYMWETFEDGAFQPEGGRHQPSFAARFELTPDQFQAAVNFAMNYDYHSYCALNHNCSSFAAELASAAGYSLNHEVVVPVEQQVSIFGYTIQLWEDPYYSQAYISTPDYLEKSLKRAIWHHQASSALKWYRRRSFSRSCS